MTKQSAQGTCGAMTCEEDSVLLTCSDCMSHYISSFVSAKEKKNFCSTFLSLLIVSTISSCVSVSGLRHEDPYM